MKQFEFILDTERTASDIDLFDGNETTFAPLCLDLSPFHWRRNPRGRVVGVEIPIVTVSVIKKILSFVYSREGS